MKRNAPLLLKENRLFFGLFTCWLLLGGVVLTQIQTGDAVLWINQQRNVFWDTYFFYGTRLSEEWAYLFVIFVFLFLRIRDAALFLLTGLLVLILGSLAKEFFLHDRPYVYLTIEGIMAQIRPIEGVKLLVGKTSFPSGHAMGAFALFGLLTFMNKSKRVLGILFFLCALTVAFSRMYLIQHFLKDVYVGSILGVLLAVILYSLQQRISGDHRYWWNRSVLNFGTTHPVARTKDER